MIERKFIKNLFIHSYFRSFIHWTKAQGLGFFQITLSFCSIGLVGIWVLCWDSLATCSLASRSAYSTWICFFGKNFSTMISSICVCVWLVYTCFRYGFLSCLWPTVTILIGVFWFFKLDSSLGCFHFFWSLLFFVVMVLT